MNIEFGTSNRGHPTLIYQGHEYVKKQDTNTTTHWICHHYRQIKCSSLVITSGSEIIKTPIDHICNFEPGATEARQAKKMKEKALTTANYVAIASILQEIQNDVATQMNLRPQETIVKSLNRYKRKFANALPHIPHGTGTSSTYVATNAIVKAVQYRSSSARVRKKLFAGLYCCSLLCF